MTEATPIMVTCPVPVKMEFDRMITPSSNCPRRPTNTTLITLVLKMTSCCSTSGPARTPSLQASGA